MRKVFALVLVVCVVSVFLVSAFKVGGRMLRQGVLGVVRGEYLYAVNVPSGTVLKVMLLGNHSELRLTPEGVIYSTVVERPASVSVETIYLLDSVGKRGVGPPNEWIGDADLSPDGTRIAFLWLTLGEGRPAGVFLMDVNGGNIRRLTSTFDMDREPRWSPNGKYVAVTSQRNGSPQIVVANVATGEVSQLTQGDSSTSPSWSPDSSFIAYSRASGIWITDLQRNSRLVLSVANPQNISWSPYGNEIAYQHSVNSKEFIFLTDMFGASPRQVTVKGTLVGWMPWQ